MEMNGKRAVSPWAVICREHGLVYLTHEEYVLQMMAADSLWVCPICQRFAHWSDETWEEAQDESE
jgi:hypothetical protein